MGKKYVEKNKKQIETPNGYPYRRYNQKAACC